MFTAIVGQNYRLTFQNSPEGDIECEGCPLVVEAICTDSRSDYLCFETQFANGGADGYEFFLHPCEAHRGQWWDENLWTRLVGLEQA